MRSKVEFLAVRLHKRWIYKWHKVFCDNVHGGFYERLGTHFKPVDQPHKRLVTQCRQLAIYAHASHDVREIDFTTDLHDRFAFLKQAYFVPDAGGWRFSVTPQGTPLDNTYDLYGNAFVIFGLCFYYKATQDQAVQALAKTTFDFIAQSFRLKDSAGFAEQLDENLILIDQTRRQNPHMHLFEACLFAYETFDEVAYLDMAHEIYGLFCDYFFDMETATLGEFFDYHLKPHPEQGQIVEPGHHFEWVWLLKKYADIVGDSDLLQSQRLALLNFANAYGYDGKYGGIYDALDRQGNVIRQTKRVWPFTEGLKANAMMLDHPSIDKVLVKARVREMVHVFNKKYIHPRGFWTESLNVDLTPDTDYMPGTTPYHVYFGIVETLKYLRSRGRSKSWRSGILRFLYSVRRKISFKNK